MLVPTATSPLTAMTVGLPIAPRAICSAAPPFPAALDGYSRAERRFRDDHLIVRAGGAVAARLDPPPAPPPTPADEAFEVGTPSLNGRSDAEGKSRRLATDERRENPSRSSADVDGVPPTPVANGGRRGLVVAEAGNSIAVLYVDDETKRFLPDDPGPAMCGKDWVEMERRREKEGWNGGR